MTEYKFEVVGIYSATVTISADSEDRARDLALESAPNWIQIGNEMAYAEDVQTFILAGEEA